MRTADFHYALPPPLIAQHPASRRDASRLLVLHRLTGQVEHREFGDLVSYLRAGDVLVLNNSRVIPARLRGAKAGSGGEIEALLVEEVSVNEWWAMLRPGKRVRVGTRIEFREREPSPALRAPSPVGRERGGEREATLPAPALRAPSPVGRERDGERGSPVDEGLSAVVVEKSEDGLYRLRFDGPGDVSVALDRFGEVPLPPYIERDCPPSVEDRERYQTVYAAAPGSVAAPTAGLHFTPELLERVRALGVEVGFVTLHVGLGTFAPVKADRVEDHVMHEEGFELPAATWDLVRRAKAETRRVIAVGTTSVRVLETVAAWGGFAERLDAEGGADGTEERVTPGQGTRPTGGRHGGLDGARVSRTDDGGFRGRTRLFLRPPADFRVVDALLTNFHLPESTLLMLVSAFAAPGGFSGRELVLHAYGEAIRERYRFFSYGDAMLIL